MDVFGTYDLIVQGSCKSFEEYEEHLEGIRPSIAQFATRVETNFISKKTERKATDQKQDEIWLPCKGGHKRVSPQSIDKIEAEGDYMRVHVGTWNCLLHHTMRRLSDRLPEATFIQLHRSSLVRIDFIDRLIHDDRRWTARLQDGTSIKVAKSHVKQVLAIVSFDSSLHEVDSATQARLDEIPTDTLENPLLTAA